MGTQLPTLSRTGVVTLEPQHIDGWWDQWVGRGALCVVSERELAPLELLVVTLDGAVAPPQQLRCEVVRLDPGRALLRLLDGPQTKPARPAELPADALERIPSVADAAPISVEELPPLPPEPPASAPALHAIEELPPASAPALHAIEELPPASTAAPHAIEEPPASAPISAAAVLHALDAVPSSAPDVVTSPKRDISVEELPPLPPLPPEAPEAPEAALVLEHVARSDDGAPILTAQAGERVAGFVVDGPAPERKSASASQVMNAIDEAGLDFAPAPSAPQQQYTDIGADLGPDLGGDLPALTHDAAPPPPSVEAPAPIAPSNASRTSEIKLDDFMPDPLGNMPPPSFAPPAFDAPDGAPPVFAPPLGVDAPPDAPVVPHVGAPADGHADTASSFAAPSFAPPIDAPGEARSAIEALAPPEGAPPAFALAPPDGAAPRRRPITMEKIPVVAGEAEPPPEPIALEPVSAAPAAPAAPAAAAPAASAPSPAATAPAPSVRAALPPFFTGDALRFGSEDDFIGNRVHLENVGALLAVAGGQLPSTVIEVRIGVDTRETRARVKVTLAAAAPGTAVVQAVEKDGFMPLLRELDEMRAGRASALLGSSAGAPLVDTTRIAPAPIAGAANVAGLTSAPAPITGVTNVAGLTADQTPMAGVPAVQRAFTLPTRGILENPTSPEGVMNLAVQRNPTDADIARPSVPLLLRWLRTTRGVLRAEVTAADHPVFTAVFVDGREVRTPASLATLGKSLSLPSMSYNIVELGRAPDMTTKGRTLHLIGEVVRGLCQRIDPELLAAAFPNKEGKCIRAVQHVVESLGLPPQHSRFVKTDLGGTQFLEETAAAAVGARTVWETIYLLHLYGGISWDDPPEGKKPASKRTGKTGLFERINIPVGDPDTEAWATFEGKDHFQVLGLHWSCAPGEIGPAYQKLRSEYGPSGFKKPPGAATAEKILKRLDEAHKALSNTDTRRAHRKEKYNLVWPHQAQLLVAKAKLELYRKNYADAKNILDAAEDISPTEEAKALLAALNQAAKSKKD